MQTACSLCDTRAALNMCIKLNCTTNNVFAYSDAVVDEGSVSYLLSSEASNVSLYECSPKCIG